ncbi:hypothetical protein D3C74_77710 [compost metagenome]
MALEVLLVMYKIREPSAKMGILLIHKTKTGDSITTSFRVFIRVIPRDFPTCIQLVKMLIYRFLILLHCVVLERDTFHFYVHFHDPQTRHTFDGFSHILLKNSGHLMNRCFVEHDNT